MNYRHTSEILWILFQTTAIKGISQQSESSEFFHFPVHIKVMFTLYFALATSMQYHYVLRKVNTLIIKYFTAKKC